jgi:hypothetical protein
VAPLADHAAEPLIRVQGWRALVAYGIALSGFLVALVGTVVLLVVGVPTGLGVAFGVVWAVCGVFTAWAVEVGRWRRGVVGHVQRVAIALQLLGALAVFVAGTARGAGLLLELPTYGTRPSVAASSFGVAAVGGLALALLIAAAPLAGSRPPAVLSRPRLQRMAVGGAIVGGIAAVGAVAMASAPAGCGIFDFKPERWRSEMAGAGGPRMVRMGEAVQRCRVVEPGMTRPQVRALLGRPSSAFGGRSSWDLGDDARFLAAQSRLVVEFERRGGTDRVSDVGLEFD